MLDHEREARQVVLLEAYERALASDAAAPPPPGLDPALAVVAQTLARQLGVPTVARAAAPTAAFRAALREQLERQAAHYPAVPARVAPPSATAERHQPNLPGRERRRASFGPRIAEPAASVRPGNTDDATAIPAIPAIVTGATTPERRPFRAAVSMGAGWLSAALVVVVVILAATLLLRGLPRTTTPAVQPTLGPAPSATATPLVVPAPLVPTEPIAPAATATTRRAAPRWQPTGGLALARAQHSATRLADGRVLVAGGYSVGDEGVTASAEVFDPQTGQWSPTGAMGAARYNHGALLLPDGQVLVAGGFNNSVNNNTTSAAETERYDPATGRWRPTAAPPIGLGGVNAALLADGRVLLIASSPVGTPPGEQKFSALLYDTRTDRWSSLGALDLGTFPSVVALADGRALVLGAAGQTNDGTTPALLLDPASGQTTPVPLPDARGGFSATALPDGGVLVAGGVGWSARSGGQSTSLVSALRFDPQAATWAETAAMIAPRSGQSAVALADGRVLVVGGDTNGGQGAATAELYSPQARTWLNLGATGGRMRHSFAVAPLADGRALVIGGDAGFVRSEFLAEVHLLTPPGDGTTRTGTGAATPTTPRPTGWRTGAPLSVARSGHTLTALRDGTVLAVGGDTAAGVVDTTARYDPATDRWTPTGSLAAPRRGHAATALRDGRVLVVGGNNYHGPSLDTAEVYDPATDRWTATAPLPQTLNRALATTLRDGRVLVVGGPPIKPTPEKVVISLVYEPATDRWSVPVKVPAEAVFALLTLPDGRAFLTGSAGQNKPNGRVEPAVLLFDPGTATWQTKTPPGATLLGASAALLPDGTVLVVGGFDQATDAAGIQQIPRAERYDPATDRWATLAPMPIGRSDAGIVTLATGQVLVVGGDRTPQNPTGVGYTGRADLYDPAGDRWLAAGALSVGRNDFGIAALPNGRAIVAGGGFVQANSLVRFDTVDLYTAPATGRARAMPMAPNTPHPVPTVALLATVATSMQTTRPSFRPEQLSHPPLLA